MQEGKSRIAETYVKDSGANPLMLSCDPRPKTLQRRLPQKICSLKPFLSFMITKVH